MWKMYTTTIRGAQEVGGCGTKVHVDTLLAGGSSGSAHYRCIIHHVGLAVIS